MSNTRHAPGDKVGRDRMRLDVATLLRLQRSAYELLLRLDALGRENPAWLAPETIGELRKGASATAWLRANRSAFPAELWPEAEDERRFGNLVASFFRTSMRTQRLSCDGEMTFACLRPGLMRGDDRDSGSGPQSRQRFSNCSRMNAPKLTCDWRDDWRRLRRLNVRHVYSHMSGRWNADRGVRSKAPSSTESGGRCRETCERICQRKLSGWPSTL